MHIFIMEERMALSFFHFHLTWSEFRGGGGVGVSENLNEDCQFNKIERKANILDTKTSFKSYERVLMKFIV